MNLQSSGINYNPDSCSPPLQPHPLQALEVAGEAGKMKGFLAFLARAAGYPAPHILGAVRVVQSRHSLRS